MQHAAAIITAEPTRDGKGTLYTVQCGGRAYHLRVLDLVDDDGNTRGSLPVITPAEPMTDHWRARQAGIIAIERIVNAALEPPSRRLPKMPAPTPAPPPSAGMTLMEQMSRRA